MAARRTIFASEDDPSRPPLFSPEEWTKIIRAVALSPRQAQAAGLVIQSKSDKEIAAMLNIDKSTVRSHLIGARARLGAEDRMGISYSVFVTFRRVIERRPPHH